jgi:hypothetical protein
MTINSVFPNEMICISKFPIRIEKNINFNLGDSDAGLEI